MKNKLAGSKRSLRERLVGFEVLGSSRWNRLTIPYYVYTGECPGEAQGYTSVGFYNQKITPKKGRRVRIENQTIGVASAPFPYSDRTNMMKGDLLRKRK